MRISVNWLRELVDVTLTPEELAETLTIAGIEVEDIEDRRQLADGVVIGKILKREQHPNADKLSVCEVDIGGESPSTIVCGAPNARADIFVAVATPGTYLPAIDLKIKPAKLRGVRSEGMICSLAELGLAKESEGIHIFSDETLELGTDVRPLLGLDDVILDISPTANRADALSMVGVAREVAALTDGSLHLPQPPNLSIKTKKGALTLDIADDTACPAYIGTIIEGVNIAPSPEWLQKRLEAAGVRPINNVVDVTNYVLLEWGQPLHAFDQDRLKTVAGGKSLTIGVRFAQEKETLKTLDGQERVLVAQNLLITANDVPVAIAGVMGGEDTEVYEGTQNIVLEAALFNPITIRRSSKSQGLRSESSARYERGVNQIELDLACARAIALITELAGGKVVHQVIADARPDHHTRSIELRLERIHQILGNVKKGDSIGQVEGDDVDRILKALGCQLTETQPNIWTVIVPSYRYRDLEREIDLIEEVARLYGYDHFCDTLPRKTEPGGLNAEEQLQRKIRETFRAVGLTEVVQYSLVKPEKDEVVLVNPLFVEYSALRTNLLNGLIDAFEYNQSQGNGALNAFEIGRIFQKTKDGLKEEDLLSGILGGNLTAGGRWTKGGKPDTMSWYDAKGLLESVFERLGITVEYQPDKTDERLHPGRTASLWLEGKQLGIFGQLHPQLRQDKGLIDEVYAFELNLEVLLKTLQKDELITPRYQPYSTYPAVERDLAFFAPVDLSVFQLEKAMKKAGGNLLAGVELFDEYKGKNVPEGERSLAFSLAYRVGDRTLTDTEVDPIHNKIREALVKEFNVTLRS
ncbi:phenylalanyl-tRNA synthetase, beta subunit [Gloeothece citriformis PCC 7424]|uniref:Phenylalanine--tRNA ligase beta subunit n=1 Tax=Gloeothece citriformis (strain PCC 7424) TaxID=65393 RepID=B7KCZ4_GLOC7|nr:phenylalanine--tRNA ligase subunit beta [Gloeothece citriformis]ACK73115.1 phenylalanyl-tRNA synthetase, beta subunit [Gloeothece citriformis PCC 7424]